MNRFEKLQNIQATLERLSAESRDHRIALAALESLPGDGHREAKDAAYEQVTREANAMLDFLIENFNADEAEVIKIGENLTSRSPLTDDQVALYDDCRKMIGTGAAAVALDLEGLAEQRDAVVVVAVMKAMISFYKLLFSAQYSSQFSDLAAIYKNVIIDQPIARA